MKKSCLFVEDNEFDQMSFKRFVENSEDFDFDILVTSSVNETKSVLANQTFDVIISDFELGDGNAFDILKLDYKIPFVIITASGNEEIAVEAMKLGAFDYIIKDIDGYYFKILPQTLTNAISRFRSELELKKYQEQLEFLVRERTVKLEKEIQERKKVEEELQKHKDQLEEIVKHRTLELEEQNKELERINELFVGREFRIKELKDKVKDLENKLSRK